MTADPESIVAPEQIPPAELPSFVIDEDAPEGIAKQLKIDELWLLHRPKLRETTLSLVSEESQLTESSVWKRLTDKEVCRYYGFDRQTEAEIRKETASLRARQSQADLPPEAAEELAFALRKRRLEVFLRRARVAKTLGNTSLSPEQ